jgi:hypothetical protein
MYTYTFGGKTGKKNSLVESAEKVVIRTRNARKLEDAVSSEQGINMLKNFTVEIEFPEADVTVLTAKDVKRADTTLRDNARAIFKGEPELRFAGRVLVDPESQAPVVYTENIFIKFFDHIKVNACERILAEYNLEIKQKLEYAQNTYFANAPEGTGLRIFEIADMLLNQEEVELCHPELIRKRSMKGIHALQWHLKSATVDGIPVNAHVKADLAHQHTRGENIIIAVIDDGFDIDHPEFNLPGKVVHSRDVTLNINDPRPKYLNDDHGTACAGVATASGQNASGVAPKAVLMPVRLRSNLGSIAEANAFRWAADHGADIISCSWGPMDGEWWNAHDPLHNTMADMPDSTRLAIEYAVNYGRNGKGCVITFAAGNGNENIKYDGYASYHKVIAVAACNDTNKRSVYSDYGDSVWCAFPSNDFGYPPFNHPDAITPGIYTTDRQGNVGYDNGDYCNNFGGTSSACPGAAGTVALMLSVNPDLTWQEVKQIIKDTAEKIDPANGQYDANGHSQYFGYGRIDAEKAVRRAMEVKQHVVEKSVKIISALVNPQGLDRGHENLTLLNTSTSSINLAGWSLKVKKRIHPLAGFILGGEARTITLSGSTILLANRGATISLFNDQSELVDEVSYQRKQVKSGAIIEF